MLSVQEITEFQELYNREFGVTLSLEEAAEKAAGLIRLYKTLLSIPIEKGSDEQGHE